jgi:chemotaxis regulatin CheY-phosphate phosphatase CheZ
MEFSMSQEQSEATNDHPQEEVSVHQDPKELLGRINTFTMSVSQTFEDIVGSLNQIHEDIKQLDQLKEVASVAEQMLSGENRVHVNLKAHGEVGKLVSAINKTIDNLQQLDRTVHQETGKVPELAAHLDHITQETESATNQVLEKLDDMIANSEEQANILSSAKEMSADRLKADQNMRNNIENFLESLETMESEEMMLQEAVDFMALLSEQSRQNLSKSEQMAETLNSASEHADTLMNNAFDIMNLLQFQDITRQKIARVIALLKEMQNGLYRLLQIFNISADDSNELELTDKHRATQDRILERDAISGSDADSQDVDALIKAFKSGQNH